MPLPGNGTISLQGLSRPGDALHSKPKKAMIVNMSVETLEALQASPHPQMQFEFGKQPRIKIGDSFFPMNPLQEDAPHEIYLRTASVAKPNAPLKYYADITGKFMVRRQLKEDVEDRVRGRTMVAEKQRLERHAIFLDTPPPGLDAGGVSKKRKDTAAPKKGVAIPRRPVAPPTSSQSSRISSPLPPQSGSGSAETVQPLRNRLIHCLAVEPRTTDDLLRMVYGAGSLASAHSEFLDLLKEIAEQPPLPKRGTDNLAPKTWKLKTKTWTEVRPYEWPKLSEPERTNLARQARLAFSDLKIPQSDPLWDYVRFRTVPSALSSSRSESQPKKAETKRPAITKEKPKPLPRKRPDQPVMVKDESSRASGSSVSNSQASTASTKLEPASLLAKPTRRLPGSGFQVKLSPTPTPSAPSPPNASLPKKPDYGDFRETKKEKPTTSGLSRPAPSLHVTQHKASHISKSEAKDNSVDPHAMETHSSTALKLKQTISREEGELTESTLPPSGPIKRKRKEDQSIASAKERKQVKREEVGKVKDANVPESIRKKRKVEDGDDSYVKEPEKRNATRDPAFPQQTTKDKEPVPSSSRLSSANDRPRSVKPSRSNGSFKFKRGSPIYTSSEDERKAPPTDGKTASQSQPQPSSGKKRDHQLSKELPKDPAALRMRYKLTYVPYIMTFQQVVTEKTKLESALSGSLSDSDADLDFMDIDKVTKLREEHQAYKDELESIKLAYSKAGGSGVLGPEVIAS